MWQRFFLKLIILFLAVLLVLNAISLLSGIQYFEKQRETLTFIPLTFEQPIIKSNKWIVVTSIQYPTEDVKKLARQEGWNLLVVADRKTPQDWNYTKVNFLSVEKQTELFGNVSEQMPLNSYTRKNLGYLYAIKRGAERIYDTDNDNKPYGRLLLMRNPGLGLNQFDYSKTISGLRYGSSSSKILVEKLFNRYRYFGFLNMWPRGFPLEYLEEHSNGKNRTISYRRMQRPSVQQRIVKVDSDIGAIYRLFYAKEGKGLKVRFNPIIPPIVLEKGIYSPWNSQNTLFHYKVFFILCLPTTVAFRVTGIWRSFFGQKLFHLIEENIAFYPVNAVQYRNAHNYLKDFDQEIDVYEKSGKIINFLDSWICSKYSIDLCMLDLAKAFVVIFGSWGTWVYNTRWIKALKVMGYAFPEMIENIYEIEQYNETEVFNSTKNEPVLKNCREVNLDLGVDVYHSREEPGLAWAADALNGFSEIFSWLSNETTLPPRTFLEKYYNSPALNSKNNTVLVLINNYE